MSTVKAELSPNSGLELIKTYLSGSLPFGLTAVNGPMGSVDLIVEQDGEVEPTRVRLWCSGTYVVITDLPVTQ